MKILFFINSLGGGGAEKMLTEIVNHLDKTKYDITVLTFYGNGLYEKQLDSNIHYETIISEKNKFLQKCYGRFLWMLIPPEIVYNRFVKNEYDCEIAFLEGLPTKIISASTQKGIRKIAWVHTDLLKNHWTKIFYYGIKEERKSYQKFDKIVCVSNSAKDGFEKKMNINQNVEVRYNFIDKRIILEKGNERLPFTLKNDIFRIISVGRLVEQKGFDRLLKVHKRLVEEGLKHELWIIGEGRIRKELQRYINHFCDIRFVKLLGFQENPYKFMAKADLFVCSSRSEGFSLALAEAMALGLPVVSTNCSGPDELIENNKYGILVSNDEQGIYEGIKKLMIDEKLKDVYRNMAEIRSVFFSEENRLKEIESLFGE